MFQLSANKLSYQPSPLSYIIPDHLTHFKCLGRILGKALIDNLNFEINFVQSFLKHLLSKNSFIITFLNNFFFFSLKDKMLYIHDLHDIDPELCKNLEWILENNVEFLDMTFRF